VRKRGSQHGLAKSDEHQNNREQDKPVQTREVGNTGKQCTDPVIEEDERKHRRRGYSNLRTNHRWVDKENGPGHKYDEEKRDQCFNDVKYFLALNFYYKISTKYRYQNYSRVSFRQVAWCRNRISH